MRFLLLIGWFTIVLGCSGEDDDNALGACDVPKPVQDLVWLRNEIEDREQSNSDDIKYCYIIQGEWRNRTVFVYYDCNPAINKVFPVFDCEGVSLGVIGVDVSETEIEESCVIWVADNFACLIDFACFDEGLND